MPKKIAIIGCGIAGLALAYRLAKQGLRPIVFGKTEGSDRASNAAQGIICNKGLLWPYQPLFKAKLQSLAWVKAWLKDVEATVSGPIKQDFTGVYEPYYDAEDYHRIVKRVYKGSFTGCFRVKNLPSENLSQSDLRRAARGTLYYPGEGWFDPQQLMAILTSYCLSQGAEFVPANICDIKLADNQIFLFGADGSQRQVDRLVVAAGHGTEEVLAMIDVNCFPLNYHPGQVLKLPKKSGPCLQTLVRKTYSLVDRDELYLGSTTDKIARPQQEWRPAGREHLLKALETEFSLSVDAAWAAKAKDLWGIRVRTADRLPLIGSLRGQSLERPELAAVFVFSGLYKNGLQLADMGASWIEKELLTGHIDSLGGYFHPSRYQNA